MTVEQLIRKLSQLDASKEVLAGYPVVRQNGDMDSLCYIRDVSYVKLTFNECEDFILLEIVPPILLAG